MSGASSKVKLEGDRMLLGRPRWQWIVGSLIVISLVSSSRPGQRVPMIVQWVAFYFLLSMPLILAAMSWAGFKRVRLDKTVSRWRIWICFCGYVALSVALVIPLLVMFLSLAYTEWSIWILGSSVVALLAGIFAPRTVRFPLFFGGLVTGGLVVIIPIGIL
jgi:hypothetical protein